MMRVLFKLIVLAVVAALVLLAGGLLLNGLPWTDPPGVAARLNTYFSTHVAATNEASVFPELRPRRYATAPAETLAVVRAAVQALGWEIVAESSAESSQPPRLTAVVTTRLWRFKDDVTVHIGPDPAGSMVHVISRSRVGRGDLGANTRHVLDLHAAMDAADADRNR